MLHGQYMFLWADKEACVCYSPESFISQSGYHVSLKKCFGYIWPTGPYLETSSLVPKLQVSSNNSLSNLLPPPLIKDFVVGKCFCCTSTMKAWVQSDTWLSIPVQAQGSRCWASIDCKKCDSTRNQLCPTCSRHIQHSSEKTLNKTCWGRPADSTTICWCSARYFCCRQSHYVMPFTTPGASTASQQARLNMLKYTLHINSCYSIIWSWQCFQPTDYTGAANISIIWHIMTCILYCLAVPAKHAR